MTAKRTTAIALAFAAVYTGLALLAMALSSPRVPYADGWRYIGVLAEMPFLDAMFHSSNGHREVLPNLVRWLDLQWFDGAQWMPLLVGMLFLVATLVALWRPLAGLSPPVRAGAFLAAVLALCWLGNARVLVHAQESVHAYLVTWALVVGAWVLSVRPVDAADAWRRGLIAGACGLLATSSFGSGIASFGAFAVVLWMRRASWREASGVALFAAGAVVATLFAGLGGERIGLSPVVQADRLLRWLAAPSMYAAWPLFDPEIAARLPTSVLRAMVTPLAEALRVVFGPADLARWPHLAVGLAGTAWLLVASVRARRADASSPAVLTGLAVAWFGLGVGGLVSLARLAYFDEHPGQLMAMRYVAWSSLFWGGLAYAAAAGARDARWTRALVVVAVLLLPSQLWMWRFAERFHEVSLPVAAAAAAGVLDRTLPWGETVPGELADALPPLHARGRPLYGWRETAWIGRAAPAGWPVVAVEDASIVAIDNLVAPGARAWRIGFAAPSDGRDRWLLQDTDGVVRGIAVREPLQPARAIGWMPATASGALPRVLAPPAD